MKVIRFMFIICIFCISTFGSEYNTSDGKSKNNPSKREFLSIGMLDENYSFVCINGEKWLEHRLSDRIELNKIYVLDEDQNIETPLKCL